MFIPELGDHRSMFEGPRGKKTGFLKLYRWNLGQASPSMVIAHTIKAYVKNMNMTWLAACIQDLLEPLAAPPYIGLHPFNRLQKLKPAHYWMPLSANPRRKVMSSIHVRPGLRIHPSYIHLSHFYHCPCLFRLCLYAIRELYVHIPGPYSII